MANIYRFERRAIYYEELVVDADTAEEALDKVENGDADEIHIGDWYDYYDSEYDLVNEEIKDPLVEMIKDYSEPYQFELFEKNA